MSELSRIESLEHDNNLLRAMLADVQVENVRLSQQWESLATRINKLCATVEEFVGRFSRVQ